MSSRIGPGRLARFVLSLSTLGYPLITLKLCELVYAYLFKLCMYSLDVRPFFVTFHMLAQCNTC